MSSKAKIRSNKIQIKLLIEYMMAHKNFANGEYSGPLGGTQYINQWEQLRSMLTEHGPDKTVEQWRHTWRDLKKKAREEGARFKKVSSATGNTMQLPAISESTEKILAVIGQEMAFGIGSSEESGIGSFLTHSHTQNNNPTSKIVEMASAGGNSQNSLREPSPTAANLSTSTSVFIDRQIPPVITITPTANRTPVSVPPVPVLLPPPTSAPQSRVGLGDRAREFLAAEEATTGVLRNILNTFQAQNELLAQKNRILEINTRMKKRQCLRQERLKLAKKYFY